MAIRRLNTTPPSVICDTEEDWEAFQKQEKAEAEARMLLNLRVREVLALEQIAAAQSRRWF